MLEGASTHQGTREMARFRSRLRQLMLQKSVAVGKPISQTEVADEAKVSFSTVQRWHKPEYTFDRIDADTLNGLLNYFECKFEDLIEIVD